MQDSRHSSNTGNTSIEIIYECPHWTLSYAFQVLMIASRDKIQMQPRLSSCWSNISRLAMPQFGPALVILLYFASLATSCTEKERSSLLQFVTELSQDGGLTSSWKNATDCCKWEGISCNSDMMVTDVSLASRSLRGHISASLANLTSLLHLNLSHNFLTGSLPLEFLSSNSILSLM